MKKKFIFIASVFLMQIAYASPPHNSLTHVAVFCSADDKVCDSFKLFAHTFGKKLGEHGFGLVTGGSRTGLMKELIDGYTETASSLAHIYGVLPKALKPYNVHHQLIPHTQLLWVETIHTRLAMFHELSDIIIVLPGGFGTLHELMDFLVHNQFALTKKPIILINCDNYWDHLLALFQTMQEHNVLAQAHRNILSVVPSIEACIEQLCASNNFELTAGLSSHYWEK